MAEECRDEGHGGLAAISALSGQVGVDCPEELLAAWSQQAMADGKQVGGLQALMERIVRRRNEHRIGMLLQTSRLPQVARKTFANYDLGRLSGENGKMVEHLQSLDFIPLGENVVIVGDPGTGKTHLAQAIGNACCDRLVPARYYKLPELVDKLRRSMDRETEGQTILHLVSVPCLIIDEVGYCGKLGEKESDLFFQLLDRRYDHAGCSTVFTSNRMPSEWRELFHDALTAKSTLDRIMDRCIAIELRGASYRGQQRKVFKVNCSPLPVVSGLRP